MGHSIIIERADRFKQLPPYLFAEIDRMKNEVKRRGVDVISMGVGDPDLPTPSHIIEALNKAAWDPKNHQYPSYEGLGVFLEAVASWYAKRFGVKLDPSREILTLIGSKEGTGHIALAFVNPGDYVLIPDPGYPVYQSGTLFAGGISYYMPLLRENGFLPDLKSIPEEVARKSRMMFINYPNNPTAAYASREFYKEVVEFAHKYNIIVLHDAMYSELRYDDFVPASFLEIDGAKEVGVEFHSLSKTYCMTGWRLGFVAGNYEVISALGAVKANYDSGVFQAVQLAGVAALTGSQDCVVEMRKVFQERRDMLVKGLTELGWDFDIPKATFYLWAPTIKGYSSRELAKKLLMDAGVVVTPGVGFGPSGEGFIRFAFTIDKNRIQEAIDRIKKLNL